MWYNLQAFVLAVLALPLALRKPKRLSFLKAVFMPLDDTHYRWSLFRDDNLYKLAHNGQTCYFRKVLNDQLDNSQRRITIVNQNVIAREYIYTNAEKTPTYLGTFNLYGSSDLVNTAVDFVVNVPQQVLNESKPRLEYLIRYYKQAGKRYKIQVI